MKATVYPVGSNQKSDKILTSIISVALAALSVGVVADMATGHEVRAEGSVIKRRPKNKYIIHIDRGAFAGEDIRTTGRGQGFLGSRFEVGDQVDVTATVGGYTGITYSAQARKKAKP